MKILAHQHWHLISLVVLLTPLYLGVQSDPSLLEGSLWGLSTTTWLIITLLVPIVHQLYVLICWRSELYYKVMSGLLGSNAFTVYKIGFAILILLRPVTITFLAISNTGTLGMNTTLAYIISAILFVPAAYLFYSVKNFFGIDRAFGIDHFEPGRFKGAPPGQAGYIQIHVERDVRLWLSAPVDSRFPVSVQGSSRPCRIQSSLYLDALLLHRAAGYAGDLQS